MAMVLPMVQQVAQYRLLKNGHLNRPIYIDFMIRLLYQHLHGAVNGLANVAQIIEMTGRLIKYSLIWLDVTRVARIFMLKLLTLFQSSLQNGLPQLALLIQVRFFRKIF